MKPALLNSLTLKVMRAYLVGVLLSVLLVAVVVTALVASGADFLDRRVALLARQVVGQLEFDQEGKPVGLAHNAHSSDWIYDSLQEELGYRVLDESGQPVLHSPAGARFWERVAFQVPPSEPSQFTFERNGVMFHAATEPMRHGDRTWFVQFAGSVRMSDLFRTMVGIPFVSRGIAWFSGVLLLVFGMFSYFTIRRTFRPLRELTAAAAAISPRSLDTRLSLQGVPTEVVPLVESFNRVLERLEGGFRVQQDFLASAAHELKTPLALIRAQVELGLAGAQRDELLNDVQHMTRQVQQLLLLAEASEERNYKFEPVDMLQVTQEVAGYLQRMAQAGEVEFDIRIGRVRPSWLADRSALFTLLKNLIENAIQHAPAGSTVCVDADTTTLTVRDRGEGADEEHLTRMFDRFWRGSHRRDEGAGLGLAICMEVARAHRWELRAERAEPGLRVVLHRPNPGDDGRR